VFLVSHDRRFLDNVVTSTIAWEGDVAPGLWREYEGGYEDWKTQKERAAALRDVARPQAGTAAKGAGLTAPGRGASTSASRATPARPAVVAPARPRKLGYKEQRELDALPARIGALEAEQKDLAALLASAELYAEDPVRAEAAQMRYTQIDDELLAALERWEALGAP
jgi:ATP-binding cassette subfamily F protein uup